MQLTVLADPAGPPSRHVADFPLMAESEHANLIARYQIAVEGDVPRPAVRNDELAKFAVHAASEKRMCGQTIYCRLDRCNRRQRGCLVLIAQKLECARDVIERARRIDYRRHGLGRFAVSPRARRSIQAWTSSAR